MKVAKVFIWLGFIALMAVSIPKVAWVFRSYEGTTPVLVNMAGVTIDLLWIVPLFVALCIDALTLALTYAVSLDKARASQISMWGFVALLCGLSSYCNLLYNDAHAPNGSLWANWFVGMVTPFIVASIPIFALCYTLILSRIDGKGETLEERVTRLEREKALKQRLAVATEGKFTGLVKSAISGYADIKTHANQTLSASDASIIAGEIIEESKQETATQREESAEESSTQREENDEGNGDENTEEFSKENLPSWLAMGASTISLRTVNEHTQISIRKLRNRVESRQIRATKNKDIVYKDSLIAWMKVEGILPESIRQSESNAMEIGPITGELVILKPGYMSEETASPNGHNSLAP
jgi:hypothetical protein